MTVVRVTRPSTGPRLYLLGRVRLHHGATGFAAALLGALTHHWRIAAAGAMCCLHDAHDFPWLADR